MASETAAQRQNRLKREAEKTKQAEADARARQAEADAKARQAEADAKREQARIEAEAEGRRLEAQRQQAELAARQETERRQAAERQAAVDRENDPLQRAWKMAVNLTAPVAGYALGKKIAAKIDARHIKSVEKLGAEATRLARTVPANLAIVAKGTKASQVALDRLQGAVIAGEKAGLNKTRGPLGLITAGVMLGEGLFSRFVLAPQTEHPLAKDVLQSVGTGSLFTAAAILGQRVLDNASPLATIPTAAQAKLESAKAALQRLRPDALTSPAGLDKLKAAGSNKVVAGVGLLVAAGAGIYSLLPERAKAEPTGQPMAPPTPQAVVSDRLAVARDASRRVGEEMAVAGTLGSLAVPAAEMPDGFTEAYQRQRNGRVEQVKGYRTPK